MSENSPVAPNGFMDGLCEVSFKIMLIGDSSVGKTCLLVRFKDNTFLHNNFIATVGIDYRTKTIDVDGTKVKLQIWDTAGQERFRSLTRAYYRDANAVMLLFDLSSRTTFIHTTNWLQDIDKNASEEALVVLVGNKADLASNRQVAVEEAVRLAQEYKITYVETSGKTGANVEELFRETAKELMKRQVANNTSQQRVLDSNANKCEHQNKSSCCW